MKTNEVRSVVDEMIEELENVKYNAGYVYEELHRIWDRAFVEDECVHDNVSIETDRVWRMIKDTEEIQSSVNTLRHSIQELLEEISSGKEESSGEDDSDVS